MSIRTTGLIALLVATGCASEVNPDGAVVRGADASVDAIRADAVDAPTESPVDDVADANAGDCRLMSGAVCPRGSVCNDPQGCCTCSESGTLSCNMLACADGFACGPMLLCALRLEYCERTTSDVAGVPDAFACRAMPASCGSAPQCGCLAGAPCGSICSADARGALTVTCPGG